jgi:hypothetical protein
MRFTFSIMNMPEDTQGGPRQNGFDQGLIEPKGPSRTSDLSPSAANDARLLLFGEKLVSTERKVVGAKNAAAVLLINLNGVTVDEFAEGFESGIYTT